MNGQAKNGFDIIVTINHKQAREAELTVVAERGATIFRLNGAFLDLPTLAEDITRLRSWLGHGVKILVDLPGYKLRLSNLEAELKAKGGVPFELRQEDFNYPEFFDLVGPGAVLRANDGLDKFVIREKKSGALICLSEKSCTLRRGKGIHIDGQSYRPSETSLSALDRELIRVSKESDVDYLGLSFVYHVRDIQYVESLIEGSRLRCLPKIESKESLNALYDILKHSRMAIVDRGDLAGEIGIKNIWRAQRTIISMARLVNARIILATQFLSHMIDKPLPSIAEVDSLTDLLNLGIDGVQLSDETSVGQYALEAVSFITEMVSKVREDTESESNEASYA
jgi:pyruvate kinase